MRARYIALAAVIGTLTTGCSRSTPEAHSTLTVFAASSLKEVFERLAASFEAAHPGVDVSYNFAGSSDLATQLIEGASADVFASADPTNMAKVADLTASPTNFATNTLTLVTAAGNPEGIHGFGDLARDELAVAVCDPAQPCGKATKKIETATGVTISADSEEHSVKDVLAKVTSGQADVGVVYQTDAIAEREKVTAVPLPEAQAAMNVYPIASTTSTHSAALAHEFVAFVTGVDGQRALEAAGFGKP